jgi:uncharacterized protein (DUF488 family)
MADLILFTLGYGNRQPADFFALLPVGAVVVDVRARPQGWNPAYDVEALRAAIEGPGSGFGGYRWMPVLGNHTRGDLARYRQAWPQLAETRPIRAALADLARWIRGGAPVVLLCAERDAAACHRSVLAAALAERVEGLRVVDL